jgi:nitrogenase iron protein NifH
MKKICIYGKGGIGKSTISSNLAAAFSREGLKVILIGCDPKADTTRNVMGKRIPTVLDTLRKKLDDITPESILFQGYGDIYCVECGGPEPGVGCAGRGIITASELIDKLDIFHFVDPDIVIYDVLGDVVCGGFATPLKNRLADETYIVTTCDPMAIYAANNICKGIKRYAERGGVPLGGIIYNGRSRIDKPSIIEEFAQKLGTHVVGRLPGSIDISRSELKRKTVFELMPGSGISGTFSCIAANILNNDLRVVPVPLSDEELDGVSERIDLLIEKCDR